MKKRTAKEVESIVGCFKEVFESDAGKKVLEYLERECLCDSVVGVKSHEQYAYLQGKRDVLLIMKKLASANCDKIKEYIVRIESNDGNL